MKNYWTFERVEILRQSNGVEVNAIWNVLRYISCHSFLCQKCTGVPLRNAWATIDFKRGLKFLTEAEN